jgi:long-chain fatty acid transport protein
VIPGRVGWLRFAFGAAVTLPDQRLLRIRALAYQQPQFIYYDNRPQRLYFSANVALALGNGLSIGGGASFLAGEQGDLSVQGTLLPFSANDSALVSSIQVDLPAVRYPEFGLRWQPHPNLFFGISYRHSFSFKIDQVFRIRANIGDPPIVEGASIAARALIADLFQPWQLTLGAAARLTPRLLVAADWTYARWSEFPVPVAAFTAELDLGVFSALLRLPPPRSYPPPGFHDLLIPRVAAEWRVWQSSAVGVDVRGGYAFEASPAPAQVGESNLVDNDKHTFSSGAGVELQGLGGILRRPLGVDVHLALTYLPERAHRKLDPLDPVGDYVSGGVVVQLGCMVRSRF